MFWICWNAFFVGFDLWNWRVHPSAVIWPILAVVQTLCLIGAVVTYDRS